MITVGINEIKKALLRQKPKARLMYIRQGHAYYGAFIDYKADTFSAMTSTIIFKIPIDDMGSTDFIPEEPAQSLCRWIYLPEN